MARIPRITRTAATFAAGVAVGVPGTLGVLVSTQVQNARRSPFLPRPDYTVDISVNPPWADGHPLRIAFLGDSLVEGVGAPVAEQSLPAQTAYRLAAHLSRPVRMRGLGVASSRVQDLLDDQVPQLSDDLDLVLISVGANDATHATPPWDFARQLHQLIRSAHEVTGGATVVFTGIPELRHAPLLTWPLRDVADALGDTLNLVQRRIAQRQPHARYIDVRAEVGDMVRRLGRDLFAADHYHPNPAGYALIAEGIARPLAALVRDDVAMAGEAGPAVVGTAVGEASAA